MNAEDTTRDVPAPPLPRARRRRRWVTPLLLVAAFAFGLVCGVGGTVYLVVRNAQQRVQHPELRVEAMVRLLTRRLDLTREQQTEVRAILERQQADFMALRREAMPKIAARLRQTDRDIRAVLTPDQERTWSALVERWRRNWVPADLNKEIRPTE